MALPALLAGATAPTPLELGIETDGFVMVLRIDQAGPSAFVRPDDEPDTVFTAAPDVVVALAAGGIGVEQALAAGECRGDPDLVWKVFGAGAGRSDPGGRATGRRAQFGP